MSRKCGIRSVSTPRIPAFGWSLICAMASVVIGTIFSSFAAAQDSPTHQKAPPISVRAVAPDLYFLFDFASSNASFLVTEEGVVVVDTRQHVRDGEELLAQIRKITDKPIKWVVNTHFHADHYLGNPAFKATGATIVAHRDTAQLMQKMHAKEISRRGGFFKKRGYDPKDVKLVMPDVTFDSELTLRLGGKDIRLLYLGPGQQIGDTFVHFPHIRALHTPGAFANRSWANTVFTPSVEDWVRALSAASSIDAQIVLPAHGDVATRADIDEFARFLSEQVAAVKLAVDKGLSVDQAITSLTFEAYNGWRNYERREHSIRSLYELIKTGKPAYFR